MLLHIREPGLFLQNNFVSGVDFLTSILFGMSMIVALKNQVGGNNETICALKDVNGSQSLPPVGFIIIIIITIVIIVTIMRELNVDVDHNQGECVCELWRRHRRADLESRGPKTSLGPPISNAWLLLGLCFK